MKIEKIRIGDDITVAFCEIPGMVDFSESSCYGLRALTANVRSENRRREIFTVNVLVKELFGEEAMLRHKESGAPYLAYADKSKDAPFISISHCRGLVAIAYGTKTVGVDVEVIGERVMNVRRRVQSEEELAQTGKSEELNTIVWTAKEALYKLIPEEGVDFSRDLHVDISNVDSRKHENAFEATAYGRTYNLVSRLLEDDKILTIAF